MGKKPPDTIAGLRRDAADCTNCHLYRNATQTVFGTGSARAPLMLVGEQPGDEEDRVGAPFVGPAGAVLKRAMDEAEIAARDAYVTNAVKHFKWIPRGKRRLHQKPNLAEMSACRPWLVAEISAIRPRVILCLGATAARSVLGKTIAVGATRGKPQPSEWGIPVLVTYHPSAIIRNREEAERRKMFNMLREDLDEAARLARGERQKGRNSLKIGT